MVTKKKTESIGEQSADARRLAESQQVDIEQLQLDLSAGRIDFDEYNEKVGAFFDDRLRGLRSDLETQGRKREAANVPVGIGTTQGPAQRRVEENVGGRGATPFDPPMNVDLSGGDMVEEQPQFEDEDDELLWGSDTIRPQQHLGQVRSSGRVPPPDNIGPWIGDFMAALDDPNAPEEMHFLSRLLLQNWSEE